MLLPTRKGSIYHLYYTKPNGKLTSITTKTKNKREAIRFLATFHTKQQKDTLNSEIISIKLNAFAFLFMKAQTVDYTDDMIDTYRTTFNTLFWIGQTESAKFWMTILTELRNRGVKDILIACVDGLSGFTDAITSVFPQTKIQKCIIHQIRNSLKYVVIKDQKQFTADLKEIYKSPTETKALLELDRLEEKWGRKYPFVVKSWKDN